MLISTNHLNPKNRIRTRNSTRDRIKPQGSEMTLYELFTPNPGGQAQFLELSGCNTKELLEQSWSGDIGGINS
ncbi:MAG: hypothetical protein ACKPJO_02315 [Dolichospermum sp.]